MAFKYLVPALALVGSAFAQCGDGDDFTIMSAGDTSKFTGCPIWNGNIIIDENVSGAIQIDYLQEIDGDLRCTKAAGISSITASRLQSITGELHLEDVQNLNTIQMDFLTSVGSLTFIGLPNLYALQFTTGITKATDVYISNTMLRDLKGIELNIVSSMDVNNNMQLNTVNVNNMTNVTTALSFSANGKNLDVSLPNLIGARNLTFRSCASVDIPSLTEVPGAVGFYGNTFENLTVANLTKINGTLAIVASSELTEVDFPLLELLNGGLVVNNNTNLKSIDGFPSLARIAGAIDLYGTFDAADLPALSMVKGAATIITSSTNSSICDSFNAQGQSNVIEGEITCKPGTADPTANSPGAEGGDENAASPVGTSLSWAFTSTAALVVTLLFL